MNIDINKIIEDHQEFLKTGDKSKCVNLQCADLRNVNLQGVNLQCANLQGSDLRNTNLQGANLQSANLQDVKLQGSDLRNTNLQGVNFNGANLRGTNLQGANLDFSSGFSLYCGGINIIIDEQLILQYLYHISTFQWENKVISDNLRKQIRKAGNKANVIKRHNLKPN